MTIAAGLAATLIMLGQLPRGRVIRVTPAVLLPLSLLVIPVLQSIPLPAALANRIDPAGAALIEQSPVAAGKTRALSLDPPETRAIVGKAGAALAVFLAAFHLASGRLRRQLLILVVAASSVMGVTLGLGHRILGEAEIFGHFAASRGLLNGPFINSNHTAEFLELGTFVCVAAALTGASALNRVGWLAAALMAGACALGTLSRGAILGLVAGTMVFVALRQTMPVPDTEGPLRSSPRTTLWVTLMLILLAALAVGLGADQIVSRVRDTQPSQELRFRLWQDSLRILAAHPFGIGRGAFERVFPVYRTVEGAIAFRFSFIENEPLQYLVEMGWLGFLVVMVAGGVAAREWWQARRRDAIEAALAAALAAVLVHNFVDFGLETLGIQLPFVAILGTLLGRSRSVAERTVAPAMTFTLSVVPVGAILLGVFSLVQASSLDFDPLLEKSVSRGARREIALRAQAAHPVDYLYVLAQAAVEPILPDGRGRSPRLHALNHALQLCPNCPDVHSAVATTLWALGKRRQALDEWHVAIETRPIIFEPILLRVLAAGARPDEVAVVTGTNAGRLITASTFLAAQGNPAGARALLALATEAGAAPEQVLLIKASLDINAGAPEEALKSLGTARKLSPQNPRVFFLLGQANVAAGRIDEALVDLNAGIGMNPHDLSLLRSRLSIVMAHQKWFLAKKALEALEIGLSEAGLPTTEAHLAAARYYSALRESAKATSEYNLALTQDPGNASAWAEMGALWETSGRITSALEAYRQANAVTPGNPEVLAAIERLSVRIRSVQLGSVLSP